MSRDTRSSNSAGSSQNAFNTGPAPALSASFSLRYPSPQEWEHYRALLTDCFENKKCTANQLRDMMASNGFKTTPKTMNYHLQKWGARKNLKAEEKEELCGRLLDDNKAQRPLPSLTNSQLRKLRKYCRERQEESESYKTLLGLFRNSQIEDELVSEEAILETTAQDQDQDLWAAVDDWFMVHLEEYEPLSRVEGNDSHPADFLEGESVTVEASEDDMDTDDDDDETSVACASHALIKQPADRYVSMSKLCQLSQQFYNLKLQEHKLRLHGLEYNTAGAIGNTPASNDYIDGISQNRMFWTKVKSGIYYLKVDSEQLAMREMSLAFPMISQLCEQQPMSLLKDVFATISPVATQVQPALRLQLLHEFQRSSERKLGPKHVLTELFRILCREEGSDELSVTVLRAMLDETKRVLPEKHPELFELQRALVRLHRRLKNMTEAEQAGWSLVETSENIYGKNHVNTRLALSECVYILNDSQRYEDALSVAEDVLHRAQLDLGPQYPDYQSVYAMEDVAEICDHLKRYNDTIKWLRSALRAALRIWGDQSSTVHILDKLDAIHDKRYQQALA